MAYAQSRSCNADLRMGMVDGTYRRINANRGGVVEDCTAEARRDLSHVWYGLSEAPSKVMPDASGTTHLPDTVVEDNYNTFD